jgi:hypothetical protein
MEEVDYGEMRRRIHESILDAIAAEEIEDTVLAGWNLIYEGIHQGSKRSLTYITSDATGETPLTPWAARGYMNHMEDMFVTSDNIDIDEEDEDE